MTDCTNFLIFICAICQLIYFLLRKKEPIKLSRQSIPNATQKVIHTLAIWMEDLSVERSGKRVIHYPMTISDLGVVAGTTRETASRVVKMLTKEKRISMTRKSVEFLDVAYFQKILDS